MPKGSEGIPLRLLVRADGVMLLRNALMQTDPDTATEPILFPDDHEFTQEWLLEHTADGVASVDREAIVLTFGNGRAVYEIERDRMERTRPVTADEAAALGKAEGAEHTFRLSTGYWGRLVESDVWSPPPQDPYVLDLKGFHDAAAPDPDSAHVDTFGVCPVCRDTRSAAKHAALNPTPAEG